MFGIGDKKPDNPVSMEEMIHHVHSSLNRCLVNDNFITLFYDIFMESNDEIRQLLANTDLIAQKKLLRKALLSAVTFAAGGEVARTRLEKIRISHNKAHMNIRPELYPIWVDSLMQAVGICDLSYDAQLEAEWRAVLKSTIDFISGGYME